MDFSIRGKNNSFQSFENRVLIIPNHRLPRLTENENTENNLIKEYMKALEMNKKLAVSANKF